MPEIKKRMVDMRELLRDLYYLYGGFKEIKFYFEYPQEPLLAEIDPEQIKRVLINIVDNAIEALTSGGEVSAGGEIGNIYIKLFREGEPPAEKCVISISDDGPGIPDELKERLFMPHFTTKKGGSGLGLAIAQRIVTEHRGFIKVKDNIPRGSTFLIELPVRS
jgi:two-component system nitrogen regulation sensor histidine kinase NtrY